MCCVVILFLCTCIFVGINIICIQKYKFQILALFIPSNTSFGLALLLVPVELMSYPLMYLRHQFELLMNKIILTVLSYLTLK